MPTNKNAFIRYHALDQCFGNLGRRYFINDLIESCNNALFEYTGINNGIKRRQIFEDIKFMESDQGWSITLDRVKDGKKVFYRYNNKKFSIKNRGINETEAIQLKEILSMLSKFNAVPQFKWIEEFLIRIESSFNLKGSGKKAVSFEHNQFLKGLNFFTELFNAIQYKKVLKISYQSFNQTIPIYIILHPYFLKQYNNRWFLFGFNEEQKAISNLPLDRISEIKEINKTFVENQTIDFEEYFDDAVGVTIKENQPPVKIILQINKELWPYIESKPIHGSQKIIEKKHGFVTIELYLYINYEITSLIFAFGEKIKVIAPEDLQITIKNKAEALIKNYL